MLLGGAEVVSHGDLRYPAPSSQNQGSPYRWGGTGPPLFQVALPRLPHPEVHLSHSVDHLVWPLPLSQELAFSSRYQDLDQLPGPKDAMLGPPVVDPYLGLSEVVPDNGPDLGHETSHLLYMVHHGAMWGRPTLPSLLGEVEESPWSPPIHSSKGEHPVEAWGTSRIAKSA